MHHSDVVLASAPLALHTLPVRSVVPGLSSAHALVLVQALLCFRIYVGICIKLSALAHMTRTVRIYEASLHRLYAQRSRLVTCCIRRCTLVHAHYSCLQEFKYQSLALLKLKCLQQCAGDKVVSPLPSSHATALKPKTGVCTCS